MSATYPVSHPHPSPKALAFPKSQPFLCPRRHKGQTARLKTKKETRPRFLHLLLSPFLILLRCFCCLLPSEPFCFYFLVLHVVNFLDFDFLGNLVVQTLLVDTTSNRDF